MTFFALLGESFEKGQNYFLKTLDNRVKTW